MSDYIQVIFHLLDEIYKIPLLPLIVFEFFHSPDNWMQDD